MSRKLSITYKAVTLIRVLSIIASFILSSLFSNSLPKTGLFADGIHLDFDWWFDAVIILCILGFTIVVVFQLLLSFFEWLVKGMLKRKWLLCTIILLELLSAIVLSFSAVEDIKNYFFPRPHTILDSILSPLFPVNESTKLIGKWQAVNNSLLAVCCLFFALFMWKYVKNMAMTQNEEVNTGT